MTGIFYRFWEPHAELSLRASGKKKQARACFFKAVAYSPGRQSYCYFFLTILTLVWLATHLAAKACKSFNRLSRSAPRVVTV